MTQNEGIDQPVDIDNKYYQLGCEEYRQLRKSLTPGERDIYLYLVTNPIADNSQVGISCSDLSTELGYHLKTIQKAIAKLHSLQLLPDWFLEKYTPYSKTRNWTFILNNGGMEDDLLPCVDKLYKCITHEDSTIKDLENLPANKSDFIDEILKTGLWLGNNGFIWSHDHPDFQQCSYPPNWEQKYKIVPTVILVK